MPDSKEYDMKYRPKSYNYWEDQANIAHIARNIKGEKRRQTSKILAEAGISDQVISSESLSDDERTAAGRVHPWFMGGEYLPDFLPNETEIARVTLKSTTLDVISIRARKTKHRIVYSIVDEYGDDHIDIYKLIQKTSIKPLTMGRMIELIDNAEEEGGLVSHWRDYNYDPGVVDPDQIYDFATVSSDFYPELGQWYDEANEEWLSVETGTAKADGLE
jgi:hypothetical protein